MAKRIRGINSRKNYKRRRRIAQRAALAQSQQSNVIVPVPRPPVNDDRIIDYYPSVIVPESKPNEKNVPAQVPTPAITPAPAVTPEPDILTPCDKRLIEILSDPAKFAEFQTKVKSSTANKLIIVS